MNQNQIKPHFSAQYVGRRFQAAPWLALPGIRKCVANQGLPDALLLSGLRSSRASICASRSVLARESSCYQLIAPVRVQARSYNKVVSRVQTFSCECSAARQERIRHANAGQGVPCGRRSSRGVRNAG
jgi:hypothetical protein